MRFLKQVLLWLLLAMLFVAAAFWLLSRVPPIPTHVTYGVTFSKFRADELKLDWKATYNALLDDLAVKHLRLVAHWPMVEPAPGQYDFSVIDYQMRGAESHHALVVLGVGRRLPSWPECHVPEWAQGLSQKEQDQKLLDYMTAVIERYKDSPTLTYWQVENEPFIIGYAYLNCGVTDVTLLKEEIALVHRLDPTHPVLLTASGELGLWNHTWSLADVFGTTIYRSVWNKDLKSYITYPTTPAFFRAKRAFTELLKGDHKRAVISELAAEPWPVDPIIATPVAIQLQHMSLAMFDDIIAFGAKTSFDEQYFWGAEWWYYMKTVHSHPEFWDRAKELFHG
jgi:hypothetical protein